MVNNRLISMVLKLTNSLNLRGKNQFNQEFNFFYVIVWLTFVVDDIEHESLMLNWFVFIKLDSANLLANELIN